MLRSASMPPEVTLGIYNRSGSRKHFQRSVFPVCHWEYHRTPGSPRFCSSLGQTLYHLSRCHIATSFVEHIHLIIAELSIPSGQSVIRISVSRYTNAVCSQYCTPTPRDVPNMAQKELGVAATSSAQPTPQPATPTSSDKAVSRPANGTNPLGDDSATRAAASWTASVRQMIWEKWRWGVVLAFAIVVSRLSSTK